MVKITKLNTAIIALVLMLNQPSCAFGFWNVLSDSVTSTVDTIGEAAGSIYKYEVERDISDNTMVVELAKVGGVVALGAMAAGVAVAAIGAGAGIAALSIALPVLTDNDIGGIKVLSAGDKNSPTIEPWISGSMTKANRKENADNSVPKSTTNLKNMSFGVNIEMENSNLLGAFYRYTEGDMKEDAGKFKLKDYSWALNGNVFLMDNLHLMGVGTYSYSTIERPGVIDLKKINLFDAKTELGYDFNIGEDALLMPRVGLGYLYTDRKNYKCDSGFLFTNSLTTHYFDGVLGLTAEKILMNSDEKLLLGEVSFNMRRTLSGKAGRMTLQYEKNNATVSLPMSLSKKTSYDIGTTLALSMGNMLSVSMGYNYLFTTQENSHNGSIGVGLSL